MRPSTWYGPSPLLSRPALEGSLRRDGLRLTLARRTSQPDVTEKSKTTEYTTTLEEETTYLTTYPITRTKTEEGSTVHLVETTTETVKTSKPTVIVVTPTVHEVVTDEVGSPRARESSKRGDAR